MDPVQGGEPQGGEATEVPTALDFDLQSVPDEAREHVASYLKNAEKHVNGRLQEAAEFRKTWEPYSQVETLAQYDPESLNQLLAWHQQIVSAPEALQEWVLRTAKEMGLSLEGEPGSSEEESEFTPEKIQQLVEQQAQQQLAPFQQRLEQFEQQQQVASEETAIRQQFEAIEGEHKIELTEAQKQAICELGMGLAVDDKGKDLPMGDASWVKAGFERYQEIVTEGQRAFVEDKLHQPKLPLSAGGQPATGAPKTMQEAREQALGRLRQQ